MVVYQKSILWILIQKIRFQARSQTPRLFIWLTKQILSCFETPLNHPVVQPVTA